LSARGVDTAGRWALLVADDASSAEAIARMLLKRYGIGFRSLLQRHAL
jgi:hypothetical protein